MLAQVEYFVVAQADLHYFRGTEFFEVHGDQRIALFTKRFRNATSGSRSRVVLVLSVFYTNLISCVLSPT